MSAYKHTHLCISFCFQPSEKQRENLTSSYNPEDMQQGKQMQTVFMVLGSCRWDVMKS